MHLHAAPSLPLFQKATGEHAVAAPQENMRRPPRLQAERTPLKRCKGPLHPQAPTPYQRRAFRGGLPRSVKHAPNQASSRLAPRVGKSAFRGSRASVLSIRYDEPYPYIRLEGCLTMCGICGFTQADDASLPTLKAMCDVMAHRGPDGEGQYIDAESGIALGHRRLSLIDLANGNQPMVRSTGDHAAVITSPALRLDGTPCGTPEQAATKGRYAIVFNGEIYTLPRPARRA